MDKQQFIDDFCTQVGAPVADRPTLSRASGNMFAVKTLANKESLNGIPGKVRIGRRIGYDVRMFACWMWEQMEHA